MKHNVAVFFRFLAIFAVAFLGITAIIPQNTIKDDEATLPVWSDVDIQKDEEIVEVYKRGIITGGTDGEYGVNTPVVAGEMAYALVRMYEDKKEITHSFKFYNADDGEKYIKKAKEYKLWKKSFPTFEAAVTREEFGAALSVLAADEKVINDTEINILGDLSFNDEIKILIERGIMLEESLQTKFFSQASITRAEAASLIMKYLEPKSRIELVIPDYATLEAQLKEKLSGLDGDWSLYLEDYKTGHRISINSHQVYSASLIKLFVVQTVYQKAANGEISLTQKLEDEIRKMITYSDNEAWKYIARTLGGGSYSRGMAAVTDIAQAAGFADTGQFYQGSHQNYNFTSVNDCGAYLRGILNGEIVNAEYSEKILSLLKQQQHLQKIPSGVPDGVQTANKTGELDYVQGDAAIVYAPSGTYILVIIGDSLQDGYGSVGIFTDLSSHIYNFLNQNGEGK